MFRHMIFFAMLLTMIGMIGTASSKSIIIRRQRDVSSSSVPQLVQAAAASRQLGGGLFALGTLLSPMLLLMGVGSFVSMLPNMFQTVMQGISPNLQQLFNPTAAAAASTGSSTRLKRSSEDPYITDDLLDEIEKRLNLAVLKYERPLI